MTAEYDSNFHHLRVEKLYTDDFDNRENYLKDYDYIFQDGNFQIAISIENLSHNDFSFGEIYEINFNPEIGEPMILNSAEYGQEPQKLPIIKTGGKVFYPIPFTLDFSGSCSIEYKFRDSKHNKPIKIYKELTIFGGEKILTSRDSVFSMTVNLLGSIRKMELARKRDLEIENKFRSCWIAFVATSSLVISIISFVIK